MSDITGQSILEQMNLVSSASDLPDGAKLITVTVESASQDVAVVSSKLGEFIMPISEFIPTKRFHPNEKFQVLYMPKPRPFITVVRPELILAVLQGISPEVREGVVRVMGVARVPGVRSKIAVASTDSSVDPIATCVGRNANRVKYLRKVLSVGSMEEAVDIIHWQPKRSDFLASAFAPAEVTAVKIKGDSATVYVPKHLMSAAVGNQGLNSALAGQLTGLTVYVEPDYQLKKKR